MHNAYIMCSTEKKICIKVIKIYQYTYSWYVKNDNRKNRHANTSALPTIPVTWNSLKTDDELVDSQT